jgi:threonine/homoserine/homoserine lactone efflux protein
MDIDFLARGFIIGLSVAAPVGPIGVLCIRRSLANGRVSGLVTGLGAATADACYGAIAAFGLTAVSNVLLDNQDAFRIVGGLALVYLGLRTFLSKPSEPATEPGRTDLTGDFASALGLTLANPATILSFAAIFAGFGLADLDTTYSSAAVMVAGVFAGSATWWFILSGCVSLFRTPMERYLPVVNRLSGVVLGGFGIAALVSVLA